MSELTPEEALYNPHNRRARDVIRMVEEFGFVLEHGSETSSHRGFRHPTHRDLYVGLPGHGGLDGDLKGVYVRAAAKACQVAEHRDEIGLRAPRAPEPEKPLSYDALWKLLPDHLRGIEQGAGAVVVDREHPEIGFALASPMATTLKARVESFEAIRRQYRSELERLQKAYGFTILSSNDDVPASIRHPGYGLPDFDQSPFRFSDEPDQAFSRLATAEDAAKAVQERILTVIDRLEKLQVPPRFREKDGRRWCTFVHTETSALEAKLIGLNANKHDHSPAKLVGDFNDGTPMQAVDIVNAIFLEDNYPLAPVMGIDLIAALQRLADRQRATWENSATAHSGKGAVLVHRDGDFTVHTSGISSASAIIGPDDDRDVQAAKLYRFVLEDMLLLMEHRRAAEALVALGYDFPLKPRVPFLPKPEGDHTLYHQDLRRTVGQRITGRCDVATPELTQAKRAIFSVTLGLIADNMTSLGYVNAAHEETPHLWRHAETGQEAILPMQDGFSHDPAAVRAAWQQAVQAEEKRKRVAFGAGYGDRLIADYGYRRDGQSLLPPEGFPRSIGKLLIPDGRFAKGIAVFERDAAATLDELERQAVRQVESLARFSEKGYAVAFTDVGEGDMRCTIAHGEEPPLLDERVSGTALLLPPMALRRAEQAVGNVAVRASSRQR